MATAEELKRALAELALDELVAAARDVVQIWREPHLHDSEEWDAAMARLAELLPPHDDGRRWPQREGDPF